MKWSTGYRIANIFFVFFNINLVDTVRCFSENPQTIWIVLSNGIGMSYFRCLRICMCLSYEGSSVVVSQLITQVIISHCIFFLVFYQIQCVKVPS